MDERIRTIKKCKHGVFDPHGDAAYCQFCNPSTNDAVGNERAIPKFNRRGSMAMTETGRLPKCPVCNGNSILTVSKGGKCSICGTEFDVVAPKNLRANNMQPGLCGKCGSGIHFVVSKKLWKCADCDHVYRKPKSRE